LHAIAHHGGEACGQAGPDRDGVSRCFPTQQPDHFPNDFVYINQLPLRRAFLEELADMPDDFRRA
jgi:hypothetical protein